MIFGASGRGGGAMARLFFTVTVAGLCLAVSWAGAQPQTEKAKPAEANPPVFTLGTLITGTYREIQRYAESAMGIGVIRSAVEFLEMVIRFLAEGAASGLNVIAVYLTEILRVTGFNVAVTLPLFTPEGVTAIAQWGLLALFGYWVLTMLLHLVICVVKRVLWVVKTVLVLWLFGLIVTDKNATADTTAVRLWGLVLGCVLLNLLKSDSEKICSVDNRLRNLEGRLKAVEKRKGE
ncbi:transmembrane protein 109-like isoform X2 [Takifugu flavidus]|uniref:transmembrane protein 109-like isoform X2 n=1 Tax=Takifugu flavidus TaxID=433684 RepID=UPI00254494C2|nr:transmembrane protein 109-like isoform X2 [Takifugu flavidus]